MFIKRIHFNTIDSTNSWAKRHVDDLDKDKLTLISADEQTAGRGRFDRSWVSPKGLNIYATFCFFEKALSEKIGHVPQVLALSGIETLQELGFTPRIKWPNDLLLNEKKVAGILAETTPCRQGVAVIIGIGMNINMTQTQCQQIDRPATSLFVEGGSPLQVDLVLDLLENTFKDKLTEFQLHGFEPFLEPFRQLSVPPNPMIYFSDGKKTWKGEQLGINEKGALLLKTDDQGIKVFHAGEILFHSTGKSQADKN